MNVKSFYDIGKGRLLFVSSYFFVREDDFPVSPGHCLIISKEVKETFFDLSSAEKEDLTRVIDAVKAILDAEYKPDGYNLGMNCGEAAGQSVLHFHCHVIPRYKGDTADPRGGIRHCIPGKGHY